MSERVGEIPLRRAYGASVAIFLAALLVSLGFDSLRVSLGLTAGTGLALAILGSWQLLVSKAFDPKAPRRALAVWVGLLKLPVLGGIVYVLIGRDLVSAPAFAGGFGIPQVAILVLVIGNHLGKPNGAAHAAPRA